MTEHWLAEFIDIREPERAWWSLHPPTNDGYKTVFPVTSLQHALLEVRKQRQMDQEGVNAACYAYRVRHVETGQVIACG